MNLTIQLFDSSAVTMTCSSPTSDDDYVVPFTRSPLDECRGSQRKRKARVRGLHASHKKAHTQTTALVR